MRESFKSGFALEDAAEFLLRRGEFEAMPAPKAMDMHAGTDFLIELEDCKVCVGLTLRNEPDKFFDDGSKCAYFIKSRGAHKMFAPIHMEIVVLEQDALDWEDALRQGFTMADEIACEWDNQMTMVDWPTWRNHFRQAIIKATKKGAKVEWKEFQLT